MPALFRYSPATEVAMPVGKREAKRIGCDDNYACDATKVFLVGARDRQEAESIGEEYVARMHNEDADMGDLSIEQEYGATPGDTICFIARLS